MCEELLGFALEVEAEVLDEFGLRLGQRLAEHVLEVVRGARRLLEELLPSRWELLAQVALVEGSERLLGERHAAHAVGHLHPKVADVGQVDDLEGSEAVNVLADPCHDARKDPREPFGNGRFVLECFEDFLHGAHGLVLLGVGAPERDLRTQMEELKVEIVGDRAQLLVDLGHLAAQEGRHRLRPEEGHA